MPRAKLKVCNPLRQFVLCLTIFAALLVLVSRPAHPQSSEIRGSATAVIAGWTDWMAANQIAKGSIAVSYLGDVVASQGLDRSPTDPAPIASLSKAITGVCALKAMDETNTLATTKLPDAMSDFFSKYRTKDRRFRSITLGQLISQDSGIVSEFEQRYRNFRSFDAEQKELQLRMIALERLGTSPGRSNFNYSNANYLALGLAIEEMTGSSFETYCKRSVLEPLGITSARISKDWAIMSSYGGWEISATDYLTFLNAYFGDGLIMGKPPLQFRPKVHIGKNRYYGPGVLFRKTDKGTLVWHAGSWEWKTDKIDASFGAYFLMLDNGLAIMANFNDAALNGAMEELEKILWDATH